MEKLKFFVIKYKLFVISLILVVSFGFLFRNYISKVVNLALVSSFFSSSEFMYFPYETDSGWSIKMMPKSCNIKDLNKYIRDVETNIEFQLDSSLKDYYARDYVSSGCVSNSNDPYCIQKVDKIINLFLSYAMYESERVRLDIQYSDKCSDIKYEDINSGIDWSGLAISSVVKTLQSDFGNNLEPSEVLKRIIETDTKNAIQEDEFFYVKSEKNLRQYAMDYLKNNQSVVSNIKIGSPPESEQNQILLFGFKYPDINEYTSPVLVDLSEVVENNFDLNNIIYSNHIDDLLFWLENSKQTAKSNGFEEMSDELQSAKNSILSIDMFSEKDLQIFSAKLEFLLPIVRDSFLDKTKQIIAEGKNITFYFDQSANDVARVDFIRGAYLINDFVVKSETCAAVYSIKNPPKIEGSPDLPFETPITDKLKGVCVPLTIANSLNFVLKSPVPKGFPVPTYFSTIWEKIFWNKGFLEMLLNRAGILPGEQLTPDDYKKIYEAYLSLKVKENIFGYEGKDYPKFIWGFKPITKEQWNNLLTLFKAGKTDCSLQTEGHVSHIKNIFEKDGKKYIEITNTLDQGEDSAFGDRYEQAPVDTGSTVFELGDDGKLTVKEHKGNVSDGVKKFWEKKKNLKRISIHCYTPIK